MSELSQLHRMPVVGETVTYPPDCGDPGCTGKVFFVSKKIETNIHGVPYVWVTVRHTNGARSTVWPSHRLGFSLRHLVASKGDIVERIAAEQGLPVIDIPISRGAPTPTSVPACRLHIDHELDPNYHE